MKRFVIFILTMFLLCGTSQVYAQSFLKRLKDKAVETVKDKVENKVGRETEEAMDEVLDGKKTKKSKKSKKADDDYEEEEAEDDAPKKKAKKDVKVQADKDDFVRGANVFYTDDFEKEQTGEFPSKWDLVAGSVDVVKLGNTKCMDLTAGEWNEACPLMTTNEYLDDEFTIEFDIYKKHVVEHDWEDELELTFRDKDNSGCGWITIRSEDTYYDKGTWLVKWSMNKMTGGEIAGENEKVVCSSDEWNHFAISFNKRAMKIYMNGERIGNIPNVSNEMVSFVLKSHHNDGKHYVDNFIIAKGAKDLYAKDVTDKDAVTKAIEATGKFVTNNILFVTGKADLKPESMAEIQKVADYMKANPTARFEVQGHCDNQGSDQVNDPLSQKRAEAVVKALVDMGIDSFNLKAVGKGSHEPVGDNKTEEGRAQNRRVEFIKR